MLIYFYYDLKEGIILTGVLVNTLAVIIGSSAGLLLKRGIPDRVSKAVMTAIGLCTIYIGIDGALSGENTIVLILSMVIGTAAGSLLKIDDRLGLAGKKLEDRINKKHNYGRVAEGFITASLLFCIGAMTIVGSLNAGLTGDNRLLYTKSVLDLISSCILGSSLGIGVLFASLFVLVFQGGIVLLSTLLKTILTDTVLIGEITCAGSVMIIGLGLNILGITKIKAADMLPSLLFVPLFYYFSRIFYI